MLPLLIHLPLILFLVFRLQKRWNAPALLFGLTFLMRLLCGWGVGWLYLYYYSANDTWLLFDEAVKLSGVAGKSFKDYLTLLWVDDANLLNQAGLSVVQDRSLLFIRIISIFNLFCFNNYWVVSAYFAFISFLAAWFLYKKVSDFQPHTSGAAKIAFLFVPSVVFWTSGIIKETLALAGLFVLAGCLIAFVQNKKLPLYQWLMVLPALYVSWGLKYYWTAIFMTSAISIFLYSLTERNIPMVSKARIPVWLMIFLLLLIGASIVHPNFYLERFLEVVVTNHDQFILLSDSDDVIHYHQLTADWGSLLVNAPLALFSGLFRPVLGESSGLTAIIASIENLALLVMASLSILRARKLLAVPHRVLLWALLAYVILLIIFLALSTPNFGTLSRYRVGLLPFFVYLILLDNPLVTSIQHLIGTRLKKLH